MVLILGLSWPNLLPARYTFFWPLQINTNKVLSVWRSTANILVWLPSPALQGMLEMGFYMDITDDRLVGTRKHNTLLKSVFKNIYYDLFPSNLSNQYGSRRVQVQKSRCVANGFYTLCGTRLHEDNIKEMIAFQNLKRESMASMPSLPFQQFLFTILNFFRAYSNMLLWMTGTRENLYLQRQLSFSAWVVYPCPLPTVGIWRLN